jgi:hypothetical protein
MEKTELPLGDIASVVGLHRDTLVSWMKGSKPRQLTFGYFISAASKIADPDEIKTLEVAYRRLSAWRGTPTRGLTTVPGKVIFQIGDRSFSTDKIPKTVQISNVPKPTPPRQSGPGPRLRPTNAGFDIQGRAPPNSERTNPGQVALHNRLKRHATRLESAIARISNTHKLLADEFNDYALFLSTDLADLDVASLWSVGTGLSEQVSAQTQAGQGVMTPELEPDILAEFRGLLMDHTAFIQGFAAGRELHERVLRTREAAQANPNLQAQSASVLCPMTSIPKLLAVKARHMVEALSRALASAPHAAFDLLASSGEVARNSIVAFARVLHPMLIVGEATNLALLFAGQEHAEVLQAAVIYLRDNMPHVAALFANDPQLAEWLAWMVQKVRDLEI